LISEFSNDQLVNQDTQVPRRLDAQQNPRRRGIRRLDLLATLTLLIYAVLATSAQIGASVAGQGLDPIWAAAQQRGALRVAVDYGFFPFTDIVASQPRGYDIDLARAVASKLGLRAEFVPSSLDSIYDDLANGKADLAASALPYAPEQGWRATFSTFYFNAGQVLIVPVESPIAGPGMLAGRRLGVPLGSDADTYARNLMTNEPTILLRSQYDTPAEVLADLRRGALDAAIVDNAAALTELGRAPGLRLVEPALTLEPYALAMPAQAFQLRAEVNRALDELRREGFFDQLGQKWFVPAPETMNEER
jgi:polar amino acid transport system substrate-binding protein